MISEPPIDLAHLNLVCNNDMYDRDFLIAIYLRETKKELERLKNAIESGSAQDVHRVANGCAASSVSYGMTAVASPLRDLENDARSGDLRNAPSHFEDLENEFQRIEVFVLTLATAEQQAKAA